MKYPLLQPLRRDGKRMKPPGEIELDPTEDKADIERLTRRGVIGKPGTLSAGEAEAKAEEEAAAKAKAEEEAEAKAEEEAAAKAKAEEEAEAKAKADEDAAAKSTATKTTKAKG